MQSFQYPTKITMQELRRDKDTGTKVIGKREKGVGGGKREKITNP